MDSVEELRSALGVTRDEVPSKRSNLDEPTKKTAEVSTDDPNVYTDSSTFLKVCPHEFTVQ